MNKTSRHSIHGETIELNYRVKGSGVSWVFLHGFYENLEMWDPFIPKNIQAICIDLPGHGRSDQIENSYTIADIASLIVEILVIEGVDRFNIVGHSMGGYVSLEVLNIAPEIIDSITIFQSTCYPDSEETVHKRNRLVKAMENGKNVDIEPSVRNLFADSFNKEEIIYNQYQISLNTKRYGILRSNEAMRDRLDNFNNLRSFKGKINYYIGKHDNIFDWKNSLKEANAVGANVITLDADSGHMAHLENPIEVKKFFDSIVLVH